MKFKKIGNSGFSLVEIIIVLAIISVLAGTVSYGLSFSSGKPAEECAQKVVSVLQHARTTTMGKYKVIIQIKNDAGLISVEQNVYRSQMDYNNATPDVTETTVGAMGVSFEYSSNGTDYTQLGEGAVLTLEFSRSTGALKDNGTGAYWQYFRISKAHTVKNIEIVPLTGRIELCE